VDSMNASMAEGFVVVEAARAAADGEPADRVADRARQVAGRCSLFATLGTFEFLQRSGRVTRLQAYAGTILDINPVFSFRLGRIGVVSTGIYSLDRSLFRYAAAGATSRRLVPLHTTVSLDRDGNVPSAS